jgi:hypothetical protein
MRSAELLAGVDASALPAQPLAIEQLRPRELGTQLGAAQPIDRFPVELVGGGAVAEQRPGACLDPSAQSVPLGWVVAASRLSASRASSASPARAAASTSSGSAHMEIHGSKVFEVACWADEAASCRNAAAAARPPRAWARPADRPARPRRLPGPRRRLGQMPGPPIRVPLGVGGLGQGAMHPVTVLGGRRAVGGGPDQRVGELHPPTYLEQPSIHRRGHSGQVEAQGRSRPVEQHRIPQGLGCRRQDQQLRLGGEQAQAPDVALLDLAGQRLAAGAARTHRRGLRCSRYAAAPAGPGGCRGSR